MLAETANALDAGTSAWLIFREKHGVEPQPPQRRAVPRPW